MSIVEAIVLAVVQGLSEFLPISSSGHLVLVPHFFGWRDQGLAFDVAVHVGTLLAVVFAFPEGLRVMLRGMLRLPRAVLRSPRTWDDSERFAMKVVLSAIPAGLAGLFLRDQVDATYERLEVVGAGLVVTAVMLGFTLWARGDGKDLDYVDALLIGMAQSLALLPGVSRSGMTISTALLLGVSLPRHGTVRV